MIAGSDAARSPHAAHDRWIDEWSDLVEFEVVPVVTSVEAVESIGPRFCSWRAC
ncbi:MAG: DUF3303 domain-containing protein [Acidobacteriota bacterium]